MLATGRVIMVKELSPESLPIKAHVLSSTRLTPFSSRVTSPFWKKEPSAKVLPKFVDALELAAAWIILDAAPGRCAVGEDEK